MKSLDKYSLFANVQKQNKTQNFNQKNLRLAETIRNIINYLL